jgi:hypothetical protein
MTKTNLFRYGVAGLFIGSLLFCFCANLDDSTSLGSGVINTVDPGKTDIDRYFHGFSLDSSYFKESFSVPFPGDTGFGYHYVSGKMFIGEANNEHSAGYIEVVFNRDSLASSRIFVGGDTLKSVKMIFAHDHVPSVTALQFDVYNVDKRNKPFDTVPGRKLGAMTFNDIDTNSNIDTVELFDTAAGSFRHLFCDSIFYACSTSTLDTLQRKDTLRFAVINRGAALDSVHSACTIILSARRSSSGPDSSRVKVLSSSFASYVVAEDGDPALLKGLPLSSFASKRTALYKYRVDSLWSAMRPNSVLLTAGFLIPNTTPDSLLTVQWALCSDVVHNGIVLDSIFAANKSVLSIEKSTAAAMTARFADVVDPLQKMFVDGTKPAHVYLYVRYYNATSEWKTVNMIMKPSFKAMITNPLSKESNE